ncbi:hypothetical protein CU048_12235 [Beijerinckiaceae bacterium]|nr:hypothetical protein CU048_12235 [Beijerinckiaceae bacterium]
MRMAHARAKARMTPSREYRYGDRVDRALGMHVATCTYRQAFAAYLRDAWHVEKSSRANAAATAARPVLTAAAAEQADDLEAAAYAQPINIPGNIRMRELLAQAHALRANGKAAQFTGARHD